MRSFIAIDMPNEKVVALLEGLKGIPGVRVVKPENLHITLKFLGEIPEDMVGEIHDIMRNSFAGFEPFEVSLQGVGVFPSMKYMRVVWVGFKDNRERLMQVQQVLEKNLTKLGFKLEKRFDPHLTIGRVRSAKGKTELMNFVLGHEDTEFGTVAIEKVVLKKSVLTPKGPIYSTIKEVVLKRSQKTPR